MLTTLSPIIRLPLRSDPRAGGATAHNGDGVHSQCGLMQTGTLLHYWSLYLITALVTLLCGLGVVPLGWKAHRTCAKVDFGDESAVDRAFLGNFKELRALLFG